MKLLSELKQESRKRYDQLAGMILPAQWRWHIENAIGINHDSFDRNLNGDGNGNQNFGIYWPVTFAIFGILFFYLFAGYFVFLDYPYQLGIFTIGFCGFCFLVMFGPKVTFLLYFATLFGTAINLPGIPISINRVFAFAFIASWLFRIVARQNFKLPLIFPFFLFITITFYAVLMNILLKAPESPVSFQQIIYTMVGIAVFQTYQSKEDFIKLIKILLTITCVISFVGVLEFIIRRDLFAHFSDNTQYAHSLRINGISKNAIQFAFNATWMIPFAVFLHIQSTTTSTRFWSLVVLVYLITACLLTFNRQTPIIISAMMIVGVAFMKYRYRGALIVGMVVVGALVSPLVIGKIIERFSSIGGDGRPDLSFAIRYDKVLVAMEILKDHWLFGIGLNNFNDYWFSYKPRGDLYLIHFDPERDYYIDLGYLQILVDTGVVGFTAFVVLIISSAVMWFRAFGRSLKLEDTFYRNLLAVLSMSFAQLLISLMIQDTFFTPRTYLLFFILFLVLIWTNRAYENQQKQKDAPVQSAS